MQSPRSFPFWFLMLLFTRSGSPTCWPHLVAVVLLTLAAAPTRAQSRSAKYLLPPVPANSPSAVAEPGEIVFRLKSVFKGVAQPTAIEHAGIQAALAAVGARALRQPFPRALAPDPEHTSGGVDLRLTYRVRVPVNVRLADVQRRLLATGAVAWVEPHYARPVLFQPNDIFADSTRSNGQYYLQKIRAYRAWDIEDGDTSVVIGITDTGVRFTHEDLGGQVAYNRADPINGLDDDNDGFVDNFRGWDTADNDNDPKMEATSPSAADPYYHGTEVSGVSSGAANNGRGVAGVGYRCRFLPVKIYKSTTEGGFAGFEGIVYAADHGCQVINCSWGGVGHWSQYEQDCITYATRNRDAVVVAAAGNTNGDLDFYPASYAGVVAVSWLARTDVKAPNATFARRVSLCAPGMNITTTDYANDADYTTHPQGSSVAAPQVAGAVALVRARFPALTAAQAAERVRMAADTSIYALPGNAAYREQLGRGRLDVLRALTDTALRSVRLVRTSLSSRTPAVGGDTLRITATFRNYLAQLAGLTVSLTSPTPGVRVLAGGPVALGGLAPLDSVTLAAGQAFRVVLPLTAAPNVPVALRFGFTDAANNYRDYEYVTLLLNPAYITLDSTAIAATITSRGDLGYDHADPRYGFSVARQPGGDHLLSEGGLLVGVDSARVSNRLHSTMQGRVLGYDDDFGTVQPIRFIAPEPWEAQAARGVFADSSGPAQAGVRVTQRTWNSHQLGCEDAVVIEYGIINQTADTLRTPYAGLYADWDIGQPEHNASRWDPARRLAWAGQVQVNPSPTPRAFGGIKLLTPQPVGVYALDLSNPAAPGPVNATNGLTKAEKWEALKAAANSPTTAGTIAGGSDVAHLVRAALPALAPGDTVRVAFAVLASASATGLMAAADSVQALFDAAQQVALTPFGIGASRCGLGAVTLTATGAPARGSYRWYAQATGGSALSTSATYTATVTVTDTFYVSTLTRLGRESARVPVLAVVDNIPAAPVLTATPQPAGTLLLTVATGQPAQFYLNAVALSATPTDSLLLTAAAQNGVYTATVVSPAGCISPPSNAITATITGLRQTLSAALHLYPNPTSGDARLTLPTAAHVTVLDAVGRVVFTADFPSGEVRLSVASQPRGVYSVRVQTAGATVVRRLVRE